MLRILVVLALLGPSLASAVPLRLTHSGFLLTGADLPVSGTLSMTFRIHTTSGADPQAPDTESWAATHPSVVVSDGYYAVELGTVGPELTSAALSGGDRWLGVSIGGADELVPRVRLSTVPFAVAASHAETADKLGTFTAADFAPASGSPNYAPASGSANYAPASGSANYIQAGTTPQNASFHLGTGSASAGSLAVSGASTLSGGFSAGAASSVNGNLTASGTITSSGGTLVLGAKSLGEAALGALVDGPSSNADALHTHADTGTVTVTSANLADGASLDATHAFGSNVSATIWSSPDGGASWTAVPPFEPNGFDPGNGSAGDYTVSAAYIANAHTSAAGTSGANTLSVGSSTGFLAGMKILVIQMQGDDAGAYEENAVASAGGTTLTLARPLRYTYSSAGTNRAQVVSVPQYQNLTINSELRIDGWNGTSGGVIALKVAGTLTINPGGMINAGWAGFRGGASGEAPRDRGYNTNGCNGSQSASIAPFPGESIYRLPATPWAFYNADCTSSMHNASGGAPGTAYNGEGMTGGSGGSHATAGVLGLCASEQGTSASGPATTIGSSTMERLFLGGGGGGGSAGFNAGGSPQGYAESAQPGGDGGAGGGIVLVHANRIVNRGRIYANGQPGQVGATPGNPSSTAIINSGGGGGGAGGTIWLRANRLEPGATSVGGGRGGGSNPTLCDGWAESPWGGAGGSGWIRLDDHSRAGFVLTQPAAGTVRVTNQTGAARQVKLVVRR